MLSRYLLILSLTCTMLFPAVKTRSQAQLKEILSSSTSHFANNLEFSIDGNYMVLVVGFNADVYQKTATGFRFIQTIKGGRWQAFDPGISYDGTFICFSNFEDTYVYRKSDDRYSLFQTIRHPGKSENKDLLMRFEGNEKLMIIGGEGNIRFYELRENSFVEVKRVVNNGKVFQYAALSANGKLMATIDGNGDVQCWKISAADAVSGPVMLKSNKYLGILDITDDLLLASGTTDSLNLYTVSKDLTSATKLYSFPDGKFSEVKFNPDGNRIIIANKSSKLETYRIAGDKITLEYTNSIDRENFNAIKMSGDSKWLAASSSGGKLIKIYEAPEKIITAKKAEPKEKAGSKPVVKATKPGPAAKTPVKTNVATGNAIPLKKANGKYIIVDSVTGKPIYETEYQEVTKLKNGYLGIFHNNHYGIADKAGRFIIKPDTSKYRFITNPDSLGNHSGIFYDARGKNQFGEYVLLNKGYTQISPESYSIILNPEDGFYKTVKNISAAERHYGMLSSGGKEIFKPQFRSYKLLTKDKLIFVFKTDGKTGLYDYTGKAIVPPGFEINTINIEENKYIEIRNEGKVGIIDKKGKTILPMKYSSVVYMDYGADSYYAVNLDGKAGVVNTVYKEIIKPEYKNLYYQKEDGLPYFYASKDGIHWGWVDKTGKVVLPLVYEDVVTIPGKVALSRAKISDTSYQYVDRNGKVVFGKKFKEAGHFRNGFAYAQEKGKYGMINTTGAFVVQPMYDDIYDISNEFDKTQMYAAKKDGKWGFLDYTGKLVIPLQFDSENVKRYDFSISEDLIVTVLNGKWGYIDRTGTTIIPFTYESASAFSEGIAEVSVNGETFKIDKKGTRIK